MTQKRTFFRKPPKKKKSVLFLSPSPISKHCKNLDEEGNILTYMFPCPGSISNFSMFIETCPSAANIKVDVYSGGVYNSMVVAINEGMNKIDEDFYVIEGDRIILSVVDCVNKEDTKGFWMSFLFTPDHKFAKRFILNGE